MQHIHSSAWAYAPAAAYAGFRRDTFAAIPPDRTKHMRLEQLRIMSTQALSGLTAEQAMAIGMITASAGEDNNHPLLAFSDTSLPGPIRTIIDERLGVGKKQQ